ncbi:MAG: hypothetical protein JSW15_01595 [Deltaproteobacteria bacterium]|nr:MAG: hypothetical protein JSW15_01595 [Deltaproteobacteria bacterium]
MATVTDLLVKPYQVILYDEPAASELKTSEIGSYIKGLLPNLQVKVRSSLVTSYLQEISPEKRESLLSQLAQGFAKLKIKSPLTREQNFPVLPGEVGYEQRRLASLRFTYGIIYQGEGAQRLMQGLLLSRERNLSFLHIVFTNQLIGTWGEGRYHLRVAVYGIPNLISTTGLVEALAKPREFYLLKQQYVGLGIPQGVAELERELGERVLRHGDPRVTEVMKGYVMQALFYHVTGDPFCEDRSCRLYNAHWHEEAIAAQIGGTYQFCPRHEAILDQLRYD